MRYVDSLILISIEFIEKSIYDEEKNTEYLISNIAMGTETITEAEFDEGRIDLSLCLLHIGNNL